MMVGQGQAPPDNYSSRFDDAAKGWRPFAEFDWFATDAEGQIALLSSAGFGAIPLEVFSDKMAYFAAARFFATLASTRHQILLREDGHNNSDWEVAAGKGLFAYDWDSSRAGQYDPDLPYELVALPSRPLTLSQIPTDVARYVGIIRFPIRFGADVYPQRLFRCNV